VISSESYYGGILRVCQVGVAATLYICIRDRRDLDLRRVKESPVSRAFPQSL